MKRDSAIILIFILRDGYAFCEKDYQAEFGVICASCQGYITGKVLQVKQMSKKGTQIPVCAFNCTVYTKGPYTNYVTFEGMGGGGECLTKGHIMSQGGREYHKHCHVTERLKLNKTTMLMRIYSRVANPHFIPQTTIYCGPR